MKMPTRFLDVQIDTTGACNLRCRMCYLTYSDRPRILMPVDLYERIAEEILPRTRTLVLSWATEPLLHPRFDEILRITGRYNVPEVGLITNATRLTPEISETLIEQRVSKVVVSMEGACKDTYERIRVRGKFEELLENLRQFVDLKRRKRVTLPRLQFNYLLMNSTLEELPDFVDLVAPFEPTEVNAWFMNLQDGAPMEEELASTEDPRFLPMAEEAYRRAANHGITLYLPYASNEEDRLAEKLKRTQWSLRKIGAKLWHRPKPASFYWLWTNTALTLQDRDSLCWEPSNRLVIWPDGQLQPCCKWRDPMESLAEVSFEQAWNSPSWQNLRNQLRNGGAQAPQICRECKIATSRKVF